MFDTLYIGTSGLISNSQGLKVVGNNLSNVNTPGFKGSELQFSDLFEQGTGGGRQQGETPAGNGVQSVGSRIDFRAGNDQTTGNPLDMEVNGNGMFAIMRDGELVYTRAGDFQFNADNVLTNSAGDHVQALGANGQLSDVSLVSLLHSPAKATTTISMQGNLTTTVANPVVNASVTGLTVVDASGGNHTVNLSFANQGNGSYAVTVTDGATGGATLGTGTLKFIGGFPDPSSDVISFNYASTGVPSFAVKLDFSQGVTALATPTTLALGSQDGVAAGQLTGESIDSDGTIELAYSNGQKAKGPRLALADFATSDDLTQISGGAFQKKADRPVRYGYAGSETFGSLESGHLEGSNVDLAAEFSNLIVMQRGYQAASHVISTANDMIQELFDMKGHT
jgi:flagellar hook protein FlgE